jgi:hypothetical protein
MIGGHDIGIKKLLELQWLEWDHEDFLIYW